MHPLVNIALRAARDAGEALAHSIERLDRVDIVQDDDKGFMTSMDLNADKTIRYHLDKTYPDHGIDSRVSGHKEKGEASETVWLIDPLVGTRNFANGYPQFAVSIACQIKGVISHAVLVNPLLREEFVASRGNGAQLNGRRIRCSKHTEFTGALLGLNSVDLEVERFLALQQALLNAAAHPRQSGCSALDIVYTACGRLAGGWCANQDPSSMAAADLILREAGGFIGSESGSPDYRNASELVFGTTRLFRELVKIRARIN